MPVVENIFLYGCFPIGILLVLVSVTRAAVRLSSAFGSSHKSQRYNRNLANNAIYNTCEEKLIRDKEMKYMQNQQITENYYKIDDDNDNFENFIIRGDGYELENEVALSDIDYNEQNDGDFDDIESEHSSSDGIQEMATIKHHDGQVSNKSLS
jgi:hypothetical protein